MARALAALVLALTMQYLLVAVPHVEPSLFGRFAVELQRTARWRYGYVRQYHGAVLVKARHTPGEAVFIAPDSHDPIAQRMLSDLRTRVPRAGFELTLYAALFGLWKAGLPRLMNALGAERSRGRRCAGAGVASTLFVTAAMMPYLVAGYGEPFFSTRQGPDALSSSTVLPETAATVMPAVSYGMLLQVTALVWPLMAIEIVPGAASVVDRLVPLVGVRGALWAQTVFFWSLLAVVIAWLGSITRAP